MKLLIRIFLILTIFTFALGSTALWRGFKQLHFVEKGLDWSWLWEYYLPFSNGLQVTRTQDTKQLLLRRVYLEENIVIFVLTTFDNKLEVDIVNKETCEPKSNKSIFISFNHQPISHSFMTCESSGESYIYRAINKRLKSVEFSFNNHNFREDFTQWPISKLKADQFKQQHSNFFEKQRGASGSYQWLRD
ncbi:threonine transporter RhtB [Vibrio artabrorum]|uniref:Threonine transporter RhtB n=1 Tax=Vibrio artabrorum TaxID=446374 RepID=A0ABT8CQE1_9VIBR|nr:threonine transporter RhtB [Vibrio artabrorum]MDN3702671.1 threonine transporter RhtB [Vibrio artabrorum]